MHAAWTVKYDADGLEEYFEEELLRSGKEGLVPAAGDGKPVLVVRNLPERTKRSATSSHRALNTSRPASPAHAMRSTASSICTPFARRCAPSTPTTLKPKLANILSSTP